MDISNYMESYANNKRSPEITQALIWTGTTVGVYCVQTLNLLMTE